MESFCIQQTLSVSQNTAAIYICGKQSMGSMLTDGIADNSRGTNFPQSSAVAQDDDDLMKALIHLHRGEQFDIILHNKTTTWKTKNGFAREITVL